MKRRLANIVIGYRYDRTPVSVGDLQVEGAFSIDFERCYQPNLVQTIYGTPALLRWSICQYRMDVTLSWQQQQPFTWLILQSLKLVFGADLGAEKFLDIKTPNLPTSPDAVVIVATPSCP